MISMHGRAREKRPLFVLLFSRHFVPNNFFPETFIFGQGNLLPPPTNRAHVWLNCNSVQITRIFFNYFWKLTISRASDNLRRISLDIFENNGTLFRKLSFSSILFIPDCIMTCWNTVRSNIHNSPEVKAEKVEVECYVFK